MNTFEIIFSILGGGLLFFSVINTPFWFIERKKEKNSTTIYSLYYILAALFMTIFSFVMFLSIKDDLKPYLIMLLLGLIISFPCSCGVILTEKGVYRSIFSIKKYISPDDIKYRYINNVLELYVKGNKQVYNYNIKNEKTLKLLADYYTKC